MKSIISSLSGIAPAMMLPLYVIVRKSKTAAMVMLLIAVLGLAACFQRYYRTNTQKGIDAETLQKLVNSEKTFVLHAQNASYHLSAVKVQDNRLTATLDTLPEEYQKYLNPDIKHSNHIKGKDEKFVLYQVHLYLNETEQGPGPLDVPLSSFTRVDVYGTDKSANTSSTVFSLLGGIIGIGAIVGIVALIACNCPQVYSCTNNSCAFTGGLYSGAIYKSLERTDYMPLNSGLAQQNKIHLRIGSVDGEEQIMNNLSLLRVSHAPDQQVLIDRKGNPLSFGKAVTPLHAYIDAKQDIREILSAEDGNNYSFTSKPDDLHASSVLLEFKKPAGAASAKLIIGAKNSAWSGYLFHEFKSMFGTYYPKWIERKDKADPQEMKKWQEEQSLPLLVSVKENGNWKTADYFIPPGNTAEREMIMQLDLTGIQEAEYVTIRLQTAYLFWDLDYAAMDFSGNNNLSVTEIAAGKIIKSDGSGAESLLAKKDGQYLHLSGTEYIDVEFDTPPDQNTTSANTWFLQSSGYYHFTKQFPGEPKINELKAFLEKGAFDRFSRKKFTELQTQLNGQEHVTAMTGQKE